MATSAGSSDSGGNGADSDDREILDIDEVQLLVPKDRTTQGIRSVRSNEKSKKHFDDQNSENFLSISLQVFIPFLVAGFGMVGAGLVLDVVQVIFNKYFYFQ